MKRIKCGIMGMGISVRALCSNYVRRNGIKNCGMLGTAEWCVNAV